jgi:hypothetical protein
MKNLYTKTILSILAMLVLSTIGLGQSTDFTYQGRLLDSSLPPTANYDFEFSLWDLLANGTQQGPTRQILGVQVTNGIFTVRLSFGAQFTGAARFLEIHVRAAGGGAYTTLAPRQSITSGPYAIRSLNSTTADTATNSLNLGGVAANQYVITTDPRMSNARNPLPNSPNYIWNTSEVMQPSSNFIISGNGDVGGTLAANAVNATTQYNIGGSRVLSVAGTDNIFAGVGAGTANTGGDNSFFGRLAGAANTTGGSNSFFGRSAGQLNTGSNNSFFGRSAGSSNTGSSNAFFGYVAGSSNSSGSDNAFFGANAGDSNTTGPDNSFFGSAAGQSNTTGRDNSFFGSSAGQANTTGFENSFFGTSAGQANSSGLGNSFFGTSAGQANSSGLGNSFFGRSAGFDNTTGNHNSFFGTAAGLANTNGNVNSFFGWAAGQANTTGDDNSFFGYSAGVFNTTGGFNSFFGRFAGLSNTTGDNNTIIGNLADVGSGNLSFATAIGSGAIVGTSNTVVVGRTDDIVRIPGFLRVVQLGSPGATPLCQNVNFTISTCSSSLRYKTNINRFGLGLNLINQLKPITFDWKDGGMHDLGLGAEDVAAIEPLLVTYNKTGQVEGVKYDRIGVVLVNAVNEQQAEISGQQSVISDQQKQIDALKVQVELLKSAVCSEKPTLEICKLKE